jgi:WD40 repeat protein
MEPSNIDITDSGPVAIGGSVQLSGGVVGGRDVIVHGLTVVADGVAPYGDVIARPGAPSDACPYPGITSFEERYRDYFFGRDEDVAAVVGLLKRADLVCVVGSSGAGKSSLLAAGVVPTLSPTSGRTAGDWRVSTLRPGADPVAQLASRIADLSQRAPAECAAALRSDPRALLDLSRGNAGAGAPVLYVVDQFEELFERDVTEADRSIVLGQLAQVAQDGGGDVKVLLSLRSDFYAQLDADATVAKAAADAQHRVLPLSAAALEDVIVRPAEQVGLRVEPALVEHVRHEIGPALNALPLLAYALRQTWQRRRNGWLTLAGYVEAGGLSDALKQGAASVWDYLDSSQRATTRRIFLRLSHANAGGLSTRRRRTLPELVTDLDEEEQVVAVIDAFAGARLLTLGLDEQTHSVTVDIGHEALLREWPLLRSWLESDLENVQAQEQLSVATADWVQHERDPAYLFQGRRLETVARLRRAGQLSTTNVERQFLARSERLTSRLRRRGRLLVLLPLGLVAALVVGGFTTVQERRTQQAKTVSDAAQLAAESRSLVGGQRDLAALLAVVGDRTHHDPTTYASLVDAVATSGGPLGFPTPFDTHTNVIADTLTSSGSVLIGAADGSLRQVSPLDGRETGPRLTGHRDALTAVGVVGDVVISGDASGTVLVHDTGRPDPLVRLSAGPSEVSSVAYDPRREIVEAGTADGSVFGWALTRDTGGAESGLHVDRHAFQRFSAPVDDVVVDAVRGTVTAVVADGRVHRWRLGSSTAPRILTSVHPGASTRLTVLTDGILVVADGIALTVVAPNGRQVVVPAVGGSAVAAVPDSHEILVGTRDGVVETWLVSPTPVLVGAAHRGLLTAAVAVAAGRGLVVAVDSGGRVLTWAQADDESPARQGVAEARGFVASVAYGPAGQLAGVEADGSVIVVSPQGLARVIAHMRSPGTAVAWTADGNVLVAAKDGSLRQMRPEPGASPEIVIEAGRSAITALGSSGSTLAAGFADGNVVIRAGRGAPVRLHVVAPVTAVAVSASHDVAVASGDGAATRISVVHADGGYRTSSVLRGQTLRVASLAFDPGGGRLASGSDDHSIVLWALPSGRRVGALIGHTDQVRGVAFDRTGKVLASGSEDSTIRLWDVATRRQLGQPLRGASGFVWSLAASADGLHLAAAHGNSIEVWPLDAAAWSARACAVARRNLAPAEWSDYTSRAPYEVCPGRYSPPSGRGQAGRRPSARWIG